MNWVRKHIAAVAGTAVGGMLVWLIASAVTVQSTQADYAGTIFGKRVPLATYAAALESVTRQALLQHGDDYRQQVPPGELEHRAWERLTFLEEARRKGIRVSDKEVVEEIAGYPLFQTKDGQFDRRGYQSVIQYSLGTNPRAFEEETRGNLIMGKLIRSVTETVAVGEPEIQEAFQRQEAALRVTSLAVPDEGLAREIANAARQQPDRIGGIARQLDRALATAGPFKRSDTVKELGIPGSLFDPVFPLQPGEICPEPVRSGAEWLVVRLDEKQAADPAKLDDAGREKLKAEIGGQKKMRAYFDWYLEILKRANLQKNPTLEK